MIGNWGHPNGNIPASAMTAIQSRGGTFYLEPVAAIWWGRLAQAFFDRFGVWLDITDGYRDLAEQTYYWNAYQAGWGNIAARPGKSNHGWAKAVDIFTPSFGNSVTSERHRWLQANAPKYGWTWTTGKASNESWHWEFAIAPTITASLDTEPIDESEEDDMADRIIAATDVGDYRGFTGQPGNWALVTGLGFMVAENEEELQAFCNRLDVNYADAIAVPPRSKHVGRMTGRSFAILAYKYKAEQKEFAQLVLELDTES